jgi:hypothetical protein
LGSKTHTSGRTIFQGEDQFSFEKPFSRCKDEKKDHEKEFGKETWK